MSSETLFYIEFNKSSTGVGVGAGASASTKQCTLLINHSLLLPPVTAEVQHAFFACKFIVILIVTLLCYVTLRYVKPIFTYELIPSLSHTRWL